VRARPSGGVARLGCSRFARERGRARTVLRTSGAFAFAAASSEPIDLAGGLGSVACAVNPEGGVLGGRTASPRIGWVGAGRPAVVRDDACGGHPRLTAADGAVRAYRKVGSSRVRARCRARVVPEHLIRPPRGRVTSTARSWTWRVLAVRALVWDARTSLGSRRARRALPVRTDWTFASRHPGGSAGAARVPGPGRGTFPRIRRPRPPQGLNYVGESLVAIGSRDRRAGKGGRRSSRSARLPGRDEPASGASGAARRVGAGAKCALLGQGHGALPRGRGLADRWASGGARAVGVGRRAALAVAPEELNTPRGAASSGGRPLYGAAVFSARRWLPCTVAGLPPGRRLRSACAVASG
jgi:hypothetical protein